MFIEALGRQMAVCSFEGATRLIKADKRYWNVVSIRGPREQKADFPFAKSVHYSCFDDIEDACALIDHSARSSDIASIFEYIDRLDTGPPSPPLLIHCGQGLSRSTAVALSWIFGQLPSSRNRIINAVDIILRLRPQAKPNRLVLTLGLMQFLPVPTARDIAARMLAEPRFARNRFKTREQS